MAAIHRNGNGSSVTSVIGGIAPWIFGTLGFILVFVQLISPRDDLRAIENRLDNKINEAESRTHKADDDLERMMKDRLTREEHAEYAKRKDRDTERLEKEVDGINSELVKRSEHMQHWTEQTEKINELRSQVSEIRRDLASSSSIGKQFDNIIASQRADREALQAQMAEIRRVYDMRQSQSVPQAQVVAPNAVIKP